MNSVSNLRSWLRRNPQPVRIILDGDPKRSLEVPQGRGRWVELISTLEAVDPFDTIALLDANGAILRATKYVPPGDGEGDDDTTEVMNEEKFPIAALAQEFRLTFKDCLDAMVRAIDAAASRANTAEDAYAKAIVARADAEARVIAAQAAGTNEASETSQLLSHFVGGMQAGKAQGQGSNGQG